MNSPRTLRASHTTSASVTLTITKWTIDDLPHEIVVKINSIPSRNKVPNDREKISDGSVMMMIKDSTTHPKSCSFFFPG